MPSLSDRVRSAKDGTYKSMLRFHHKNQHSLRRIIRIVKEVCASEVAGTNICDASFIDVGVGQFVVKPIARDGIEKRKAEPTLAECGVHFERCSSPHHRRTVDLKCVFFP
jgi:hypothetical protein